MQTAIPAAETRTTTPAPATTLTLVSDSVPTYARLPRAANSPDKWPYLPRTGPICLPAPELPPRRFKAGKQPRDTITTAEAAACLGITPGRLRAEAKSWGLKPFAYGPHNAAVYWRKAVEEIRAERQWVALDRLERQVFALVAADPIIREQAATMLGIIEDIRVELEDLAA